MTPSGESIRVKARMVYLQCESNVIHTWALQRWVSYYGALYKCLSLPLSLTRLNRADLAHVSPPVTTWSCFAPSCQDCPARSSSVDWNCHRPVCRPSMTTLQVLLHSVDSYETSACVGKSHAGTQLSPVAADMQPAWASTDSPTRCGSL